LSSEKSRKAAYRIVAALIEADFTSASNAGLPSPVRFELLRIRDAMATAGNVPELQAEGLVLQ
jgi:hypothetical protein